MEKVSTASAELVGGSPKPPLEGITILLIEDSKYFSEAIRLLALRYGARLRRADCVEASKRHLMLYRPDVMIVDLGLPDGSGEEIIESAASAHSPPVIIAVSGEGERVADRALNAGAEVFLPKTEASLVQFHGHIVELLRKRGYNIMLGPQSISLPHKPDARAYCEDLEQILLMREDIARDEDDTDRAYYAQFVRSVALAADDTELVDACVSDDDQDFDTLDRAGWDRIQKLVQERIDKIEAGPKIAII